MASNTYGWLIPNVVGAIGGTYVMLHLSTNILKWGDSNVLKMFLIWAGKNTLVILGFSGPLNMVMKDSLCKWFPNMPNTVNTAIRHPLLWLLLYFLSLLLIRYTPFLIGKTYRVELNDE